MAGERSATGPSLRGRQNVATRPLPAFQTRGVGLGQAGPAHFCRGSCVIIGEGMELDEKAVLPRRECGEPRPRRAIIGRQPDRPRIVPEPSAHRAGERRAAMAADYRAGAREVEFGRLLSGRRRGEDKAVDQRDAAMDDLKAPPREREGEAAREPAHPGLGSRLRAARQLANQAEDSASHALPSA